MLPALPQDPRDRDRVVVVAPRREVVEIRTDDQRVLHILEPVSTGLVPHRLSEHIDVATATPTNGQALVWVSSTSKWTPSTVSGSGDGITLVEADARYYQRALVDTLLDGKDDEGTALTIFTNHVAASDPHHQYALTASLAPVATSGLYSALTGRPTIPATFDDLSGTVPTSALPALAITDTFTVGGQAAMLALTAQRGDVAVRSDLVAAFILAAEPATVLANWVRLPTPVDAVLSVNAQTGVVVLGKGDVGLGAVANLAPADLPLSSAAVIALSGKAGTNVTDALGDRLDVAETAITTKADGTATTNALAGKISTSLIDAKGDLIVGTADNVLTRLAAGSDGHVLTVDSAQVPGVKWAPAAGGGGASGIKARSSTGRFIAVFGPCGNSGTWTVCPNSWRPPPMAAAVGDVVDLRAGGVLGATNASGDAEFDIAAIDNSDTLFPVVLRCLSSNSSTPLPNGDGDLYAWVNNARSFKGVQDWVVQSGDLVGGTITLAILYRAGGSGLSFGHGSVYPNHVTMINYGAVA